MPTLWSPVEDERSDTTGIHATDLERLRAAGFTEPQISAPADTIQHATRDLVTRDHLDLRLGELREHIDSGLGRQKN